MKKIMLLSILTMGFIKLSYAQTYSFINDIFKEYKSDTIYVEEKFIVFDVESLAIKFSKENIEYLWAPMPHPKIPSIKPFLDNFNLSHFRGDLLNNKNDTLIDFSKLAKHVFKSSKEYMMRHASCTYISISKPIYNCSKNWVIIFISSANLSYDIGSGNMCIYRKIDGKWILYHKVELWLS